MKTNRHFQGSSFLSRRTEHLHFVLEIKTWRGEIRIPETSQNENVLFEALRRACLITTDGPYLLLHLTCCAICMILRYTRHYCWALKLLKNPPSTLLTPPETLSPSNAFFFQSIAELPLSPSVPEV